MAIFHLSVKTVSRSAGRSATAAAAYRAGCSITDAHTGEVHDYSRKGGVLSADLILPANSPEWASDRSALWNAAEQAETRKNSTVAREFEIALPDELSAEERRNLAIDFAREIVDRHGCVADVALHHPGKEGDNRNWHAHILCSTRRLTDAGFKEKTRELDDLKTGEVTRWRERYAQIQNERLKVHGQAVRVDHRSLKAQGADREPTDHLGPVVSEMKRRGKESRVLLRIVQDHAEAESERKHRAHLDKLMREIAHQTDLKEKELKRLMRQQAAFIQTPAEAPLPVAETIEQYVARKSEETDRRYTIAKIGQRIVGTLLKLKEFAGQIYGLIDVGRGDRLLVEHDFQASDLGKLFKGYQEEKGMKIESEQLKVKGRTGRA